MSGLVLVTWCLVLDLLTGAALPLTCIRAIACCDQGVHPISGHCTRSDRVQCSLTGASPEKSHAILPRAFQILKPKRCNHAVSEVLSICVGGELHAKVWDASAAGWALRP